MHEYIKGLAIIHSIKDKNTFFNKFFESGCLKFVQSINCLEIFRYYVEVLNAFIKQKM